MDNKSYTELEIYHWRGIEFSSKCMGYTELAKFSEVYITLLEELLKDYE